MKISNPLVSGFASTLLVRLALGVGISAALVAIASVMLPQSASAQPTDTVQPLQDFNTQQNEVDPFTGRAGGSGFSVFDLIHNSRLYNSRDMNEFTVESRENIDDAAAQYRQQQLQRLGNPESPVAPDTTQTPSEELTQ
jgi:hypothetical protein